MTRIITVANQKGGVGKTTSAVNIAAAIALAGHSVLVIDMDPQGNASTALGAVHTEGTPSVYEVLTGDATLADVDPAVPRHPRAVDGARPPSTWPVPRSNWWRMVAREYRLSRAVDALLATRSSRTAYSTTCFLDCPPSLGLLTLNGLVAAREVLLPIQCEYYALEGLSQLLRTVDMVRTHLNPALVVSAILLTMYDGRTRLASQVADEVRTHFGAQVLDTVIPRSVRISEAPSYGQTVLTYDPTSPGALAYREAALQVLPHESLSRSTELSTDI